MGYALVSAGAVTDNGGASTGTAAFGQPTTAGNLLIAFMNSLSSSTIAPYSTSATGWTQAVVQQDASGSGFTWPSIWYRANCGASETAPSFSITGGFGDWWIQLAEFSGGATSSPLDQAAGASPGFVAGGTPITVTAAAADAAGGNLIAAVYGGASGSTGPATFTPAATDSSGASVPVTVAGDDHTTATANFYSFFWGAAAAAHGASKDTASLTNSVSVNRSAIVIATFKAAAAAAGGAAPVALVIPQAAVMQAANW